MKKQIISIVFLALIVVLMSYMLAIFKIESKLIWGLFSVFLAYFACVATGTSIYRLPIKENTALFALLAGIGITHIPWWISHHINYGVSFGTLIEYFFMGTKMFYSVLGVILGYLLYKLMRLLVSKKTKKSS